MTQTSDARPVLIIAGPTASGKSALAADIAERAGGVVINADSMQIYRGLAVLTSAPDEAMRARVPHRLYGILDPAEPCSAGHWRDLALAEIGKAHAAGRLPVVVGGTGLYLRVLVSGIARMPAVPREVRDRVRARLARDGSGALHDELARRDPASAARLPVGDGQRIARALEVLEATGRSLSDWQRSDAGGGPAGIRFTTCVLMPPREVLYHACDARFTAMLEGGALDEVRTLARRGLTPDLPALRALGVPELMRHLAGGISLDEARRRGQQATRRYVKRQMTWFRHQIIANYVIESEYNESTSDKIFSFILNLGLTGLR